MNADKHLKYIFYPDICQKLLHSNHQGISHVIKRTNISFSYIFSTYNTYNPIAIKMILSLEAVGLRVKPERVTVRMSFGKQRTISRLSVFLNKSFLDLYGLLLKAPLGDRTHSQLNSSKYLPFPGFTQGMFFPGWERQAILAFHFSRKERYISFLFKTAYLD